MRGRRGFTLIELLIVVAIIGILAAIAVPNLLNALGRGRQRRTMADIRAIVVAVEAYGIDMGRYPLLASGDCNTDLESFLRPTYIRVIPPYDAWSVSYHWIGDGVGGTTYTIWSGARDRNTTIAFSGGPTTNFDADIVFSGSSYTQWPEGVQTGQ